MKKKPHILITNDDGIHAMGLYHLWKALNRSCRLTIVAPETEQSCTGLGITTRSPLKIGKVLTFDDTAAWSVSGTPADCVKLARSKLLESPPDLIVAGINRGSNAGRNVMYSGTVAGVVEGVMGDIPGIAFSSCDYSQPDYTPIEPIIPTIVDYVLEHHLPAGTILNVNFPMKSAAGYQGIRMTRQGKQYWTEDPDEREHPTEKHSYYWLGARVAKFDEHEDSDVFWLEKGYITAVPIHVHELTDHAHLQKHKKAFDSLM